MSYMVDPGGARQPGRRRVAVGVAVVLGLAAVALLVYVAVGRGSPAVGSSGAGLGEAALSWDWVRGQPVPRSPHAGPRTVTPTTASGFSHDELGAVVAAVNISTRLSQAAGADVYYDTARSQCVGDVAGLLNDLQWQTSTSAPGTTTPLEFLYKVDGDATGDVAVVSLAVSTLQTKQLGGYGLLVRTLRWVDGDWKVQLPLARPQVVTSVDGFSRLGAPGAPGV